MELRISSIELVEGVDTTTETRVTILALVSLSSVFSLVILSVSYFDFLAGNDRGSGGRSGGGNYK